MKHTFLLLLFMIVVSDPIFGQTSDQPNAGKKMTFQGSLFQNGEPFDGTTKLKFTIPLDSMSWTETHESVTVINGLYSVVLGQFIPLPTNLFFNVNERTVKVQVDDVVLGDVKLYSPFSSESNFLLENDKDVNDRASLMVTQSGSDGSSWAAFESYSNAGVNAYGVYANASGPDANHALYGDVRLNGNSVEGAFVGIGTAGSISGVAGNPNNIAAGVYGMSNTTGSQSWGTGGFAGGDLTNIAIRGRSNSTDVNTSTQYGGWLQANGQGTGEHYGTWTRANGLGRNVGLYATADGGAENWAGWFDGGVKLVGNLDIDSTLFVNRLEMRDTLGRLSTLLSRRSAGGGVLYFPGTNGLTYNWIQNRVNEDGSASGSSQVANIASDGSYITGTGMFGGFFYIDSWANDQFYTNVELGLTQNDPKLPYMHLRGSEIINWSDDNGTPDTTDDTSGSYLPNLLDLEVQKWDDGTEIGALTLRGSDGSEFRLNSHGIQSNQVQVGPVDGVGTYTQQQTTAFRIKNNADPFSSVFLNRSVDGSARLQLVGHNAGVATGTTFIGTSLTGPYMYMNGPLADGSANTPLVDLYTTGNTPDGVAYTNNYKRAGIDFYDNEGARLAALGSRRDENGSDPTGASGLVLLWGKDNVPNVEMSGKVWENAKLPILQLFGETTDGGTWYHASALIQINSNGTDEWGQLVLKKSNMAGQSTQDMINLDGEMGNITIAGTLAQNSDERLKTNINTLDGALDKTLNMRGVSYTWKDEARTQKTQIGVIAQEVEAIYPEFVETNDQGIKSVNYAQMTAVLIESIKELNAKIEVLKTENTDLKAELTKSSELESRLAQIEKLLGVAAGEGSNAINK